MDRAHWVNSPVTYPEVWACEDRDGEKALLLINEFSALPEQDGAQTCTRCGESSPASFDICWLCHTPLAEQE